MAEPAKLHSITREDVQRAILEKRVKDLTAHRDQLVANANRELYALNAVIGELNAILNGDSNGDGEPGNEHRNRDAAEAEDGADHPTGA